MLSTAFATEELKRRRPIAPGTSGKPKSNDDEEPKLIAAGANDDIFALVGMVAVVVMFAFGLIYGFGTLIKKMIEG
ncbi:hypothetical protein HDU98_002558 [Podochytrium sp. JEL0797]|nr:hypothetical protein HDU98_002558 [Podochytrium sp. JEL0797]